MTAKLFRHPEIYALPERGAFTPLECLTEWRDTIEHALGRYLEWSAQPDKAADIWVSAKDLFTESAGDLEKLLPYLETEDDTAGAHRLGELRDRLRDLFGDDAAAPQPVITTNEAELIAAEAAKLLAFIQQQIGIAHTMMRQAGPPPLSDGTRAQLCEGWRCMARTIICAAELPELDLAAIDALETLIEAADRMHDLWEKEQAVGRSTDRETHP